VRYDIYIYIYIYIYMSLGVKGLIADVRQAFHTQHLDMLTIHLSAKFHMHSSNSLSTFATKPAAKQTSRTAAILYLKFQQHCSLQHDRW
jgi:hypothetical protein